MNGVRRMMAASFAALLVATSGATLAKQVTVSILTHWPPETVAQLKVAADRYRAAHPDVAIEIRAVPFGDLLTTVRSQAGRSDGPTIAGIYDLWLPELVRDGIVVEMPPAQAADVRANWIAPCSAVPVNTLSASQRMNQTRPGCLSRSRVASNPAKMP